MFKLFFMGFRDSVPPPFTLTTKSMGLDVRRWDCSFMDAANWAFVDAIFLFLFFRANHRDPMKPTKKPMRRDRMAELTIASTAEVLLIRPWSDRTDDDSYSVIKKNVQFIIRFALHFI